MSNNVSFKMISAIAYGWLWHVTTDDPRVNTARQILGEFLKLKDREWGINMAKQDGATTDLREAP